LKDLHEYPKFGASWEGYAIQEVLRSLEPDEAYFWSTHGGAEIDLVYFKHGKICGVECKYVDAPRLSPSIHIALSDLKLEKFFIIYPGTKRYPLNEKVEAMPLEDFIDQSKNL
jgi:predicted AAA+ superfamily ATPase